ncbi:uncharacterized protein [Cicer arietinum]|uniref:Uncharacterized protein LOC101499615 n=1 Tax=Cicer arietinum TaxID=3827 RepID=A0A3Q7XET6_CICAR|nr:uncharacterized protein LOC101499615 [Cicer arietinum]
MSASYRKSSGQVLCSSSSPGKFNSRPPSHPHSSSNSATFFHRSTFSVQASSVLFSFDSCVSPNSSISFTVSGTGETVKRLNHRKKRTCMCSPSTHPGSFRCSFHKSLGSGAAVTYAPNRLNARRSAMTNSLVRIRGVEGELVKKALASLIRPSSHNQRRRYDFQPRPSRFKAEIDA